MVYKIDGEGYLLDVEGRYMLNAKYEQIKLSPPQLEAIREKGLIL